PLHRHAQLSPTLPPPTPFPYTTLFRSLTCFGPKHRSIEHVIGRVGRCDVRHTTAVGVTDAPQWTSGVVRRFRQAAGTGGLSETRSEEHTSELQSRGHLVCRLLLEQKNH